MDDVKKDFLAHQCHICRKSILNRHFRNISRLLCFDEELAKFDAGLSELFTRFILFRFTVGKFQPNIMCAYYFETLLEDSAVHQDQKMCLRSSTKRETFENALDWAGYFFVIIVIEVKCNLFLLSTGLPRDSRAHRKNFDPG